MTSECDNITTTQSLVAVELTFPTTTTVIKPTSRVSVRGTWDNWACEVHLTEQQQGQYWSVVLHLKPGHVQFRFICDDDQWVTAPNYDSMPNGHGETNNCLLVVATAAAETTDVKATETEADVEQTRVTKGLTTVSSASTCTTEVGDDDNNNNDMTTMTNAHTTTTGTDTNTETAVSTSQQQDRITTESTQQVVATSSSVSSSTSSTSSSSSRPYTTNSNGDVTTANVQKQGTEKKTMKNDDGNKNNKKKKEEDKSNKNNNASGQQQKIENLIKCIIC